MIMKNRFLILTQSITARVSGGAAVAAMPGKGVVVVVVVVVVTVGGTIGGLS